MTFAALFLILGVVQLIDCTYSPGANKICLSCQGVQDPRACTHFVQAWQREVCTAERFVLLNGTTVWNLGYEAGITCQDNIVIPRTQKTPSVVGTRGMAVCHECCQTDLCNSKLCASTMHNGLVCLKSDTNVSYCNQGERCYATQPSHSRPGQLQYGCASQAMCTQIPESSPHATCQRCCDSDGCNMHVCSKPSPVNETISVETFSDCWDLHSRGGFTQDGVYDIYPAPDNTRMRVRCDMQTDGGGWTVIFRRYDGSLSFANRTFDDYATGFGELSGEFWFGLDDVYQLTSQSTPVSLRVDMCSRSNPESQYVEYDTFFIGNRSDNYRLHVGPSHGTTSNRMGYFNLMEFRFTDSCSAEHGAWWHYVSGCVTGLTVVNYNHLVWYEYRSAIEMKVRPMSVNGDDTTFPCPGQS